MSTDAIETVINLGAEYDESLRDHLTAVLKEMGAVITDHKYGVVGSQEVEILTVTIRGHVVVVEAETYMGLTVKGEKQLVDSIAARMRTRLNEA